MFVGLEWKIIVYFQSTINAYSLLSHEWWVPLIKFMVRPTIHVRGRGGVRIYGTLGVPINFPSITRNTTKFHKNLTIFLN